MISCGGLQCRSNKTQLDNDVSEPPDFARHNQDIVGVKPRTGDDANRCTSTRRVSATKCLGGAASPAIRFALGLAPRKISMQLQKLTRREFRERMQAGTLRACILPLAAIEQHLEHLAMEHDWRSVTAIASRVAEELAPQVLVAEAVQVGISEHHMIHRGTLTLRPGTFLAVVNDLIRSLVHAGFENILVLNGHGGNVAPCQTIWDQYLREFQVNLQFLSYWDVLTQEDARELLRSGDRLPDDLPGHAQEFETSVALALFPENVRSSALVDQADPTPAMADAERGKQFVDRVVTRVAAYLQSMIDGQQKAGVPPFHP